MEGRRRLAVTRPRTPPVFMVREKTLPRIEKSSKRSILSQFYWNRAGPPPQLVV